MSKRQGRATACRAGEECPGTNGGAHPSRGLDGKRCFRGLRSLPGFPQSYLFSSSRLRRLKHGARYKPSLLCALSNGGRPQGPPTRRRRSAPRGRPSSRTRFPKSARLSSAAVKLARLLTPGDAVRDGRDGGDRRRADDDAFLRRASRQDRAR